MRRASGEVAEAVLVAAGLAIECSASSAALSSQAGVEPVHPIFLKY